MIRFRRDSTWRQPGDGRVVLAGSPLRLFRLSTGGAAVIERALEGDQPDTDPVARMLDRFVEAGALHPQHTSSPFTAADVTVVIPVFGTAPTPPTGVRTVMVDDASTPPVDAPPNCSVLRRETNGGPAAARNTGLAAVDTPLVAFIDADVAVDDGWLEPLLAHFSDPRVALVAPRVASAEAPGLIGAYEHRHSPLDLGPEPARIAAGTRVSYVPAATLVCRTDVIRSLGGFDESMRVGEDVDLVWRLVDAGHRARYEPASVVHHRPRSTVFAMLRQRAGYGRSAAPLARAHPGAVAPVRMSGWSAAVWALAAWRRPALAALVAVGTAAALSRKLRDLPPAEAVRLTMLGHLAAGRQLAKAATRVWWPIVLACVFLPRRLRPDLRVIALGWVAASMAGKDAEELRHLPLLLADEVAYGTGVWQGVVTQREPSPLLPDFTTWPRRGDG